VGDLFGPLQTSARLYSSNGEPCRGPLLYGEADGASGTLAAPTTTRTQTMPRPIRATVHSEALAHNLALARRAAGDAKVWAVVKADAYGHGIERVFDALRAADGFALLDLAEAQRVRALGWRGPILLLEGAFELRDLERCSRLDLWHVVHCTEQIDMLATHKTQVPHRVFLKMNSGMNRLGLRPAAFRAAWTRLNALPQVDEITLMTHFSDADATRQGGDGIAHQVDAFVQATHDLAGERSLCNSAATLRHAGTPLGAAGALTADWVRPGIAVYGSAPDHPTRTAGQWGLRPAMTLSSKLIGGADPGSGRHGGIRVDVRRQRRPSASVWWPVGMPMATHAQRPAVRLRVPRCWWRVCAPAWLGASAWTCSPLTWTPSTRHGPLRANPLSSWAPKWCCGATAARAPCCPSMRWPRPPRRSATN
jgi:alanine racemase